MWGAYDEENAVKAIETALANGINIIDTAPVYGNGHAEELIGKVIKNQRDKVLIATKCGLDVNKNYTENLKPEFIAQEIANSLKRLQTDHIDIYQCHWPDHQTAMEETMAKLIELKQQGKIRYIGISNFSAEETKRALKYAPILTHQPNYSLVERTIEKDLQKTCVENNIAIIPYGSLGGGMLTGKYQEWPELPNNDARTVFYKCFQKKYWPNVSVLVNKLRELAADKKTTPGNIALAWLMAQPGVASPIVGAKNPAQVLENINFTELQLSPAEIAELGNLSAEIYK